MKIHHIIEWNEKEDAFITKRAQYDKEMPVADDIQLYNSVLFTVTSNGLW